MTQNKEKIEIPGKKPAELTDEDILAVNGGTWEPERSPGNWDNPSGTTPAVITGDERQWLKESGDGTKAWYGLENPRD